MEAMDREFKFQYLHLVLFFFSFSQFSDLGLDFSLTNWCNLSFGLSESVLNFRD